LKQAKLKEQQKETGCESGIYGAVGDKKFVFEKATYLILKKP
jgi:hypothetical protein